MKADKYEPLAYFESAYQREQAADHFAKHFLMPTSNLTRQYHALVQGREAARPTVGDLCVLAHYFGVSLSALVRRLEDLRLAPAGAWERLREGAVRVREAQQQLGLPPLPEQGAMLPLRYQYLAVEAFKAGKLSEGLLAQFLRLDRLEARSVVRLLSQHEEDITQEQVIDLSVEALLDA